MFARVASLRANTPVGRASSPTCLTGASGTLSRRAYNAHTTSYTPNTKLNAWISEMEKLCQPTRVHVCSGSDQENAQLIDVLIRSGALRKLDPSKRPNSYAAFSDPEDVARVEDRTYICSRTKEDAGPTNNWVDPDKMAAQMQKNFAGSMHGRTMYVVPYSMGPIGSPLAQLGVQITDSPYVTVNMRMMTRMGAPALTALGQKDFVRCAHTVGAPLPHVGAPDKAWPCNPSKISIAHFPENRTVWSYGSGYGGNSLLGKKCFALRIASQMGREEGWLAEHMLILGITNPAGKKRYFAAAFPSACGKTNLAMLTPKLPGWKVETVGDDICWMRFGSDGRLWAINPEAGFFGVAPGTNSLSNPNALATVSRNALFTNVALTNDGDVWWEGLSPKPPQPLRSWRGEDYVAGVTKGPAAHANSRFTVSAAQCPVIDPAWERPEGVPIDAIIFGGRRSGTVPLVYEAFNWDHGTFVGATVNSETTAAATGAQGVLRPDPFAMRPFCGYNMGDYFGHWLSMGDKSSQDPSKLPRIFHVNWFRKGPDGKFLWPGFGDNIRVLKWMFARLDRSVSARPTPIGLLPESNSLDVSGLDLRRDQVDQLLHVEKAEWHEEAKRYQEFLGLFGNRLPERIDRQREQLQSRLDQL